MRKILVFIFALGFMSASGQYLNLILDFEDQYLLNHVIIDTLNNPDNIWQIGEPQKTIFNQSYSVPNGIMTDTINAYPSQDTSSFIIKFAWAEYFTGVSLNAYYKFDSDTLSDFGTIEISLDQGITWSNVLEDSIIPDEAWHPQKPIFTGTIDEWRYFRTMPSDYYPINLGDSVYYRFTFISDNVQTNREGWLLDNIQVIELTEGQKELVDQIILTKIYPNPVRKELKLFFENDPGKFDFRIYNQKGVEIYRKFDLKGDIVELNIGNLQTGIYFYRIDLKEQKEILGKIIKN